MKLLILTILLSFTFSLQAQDDIFDQKKNEVKREQDIMNFIKSDIELYNHYKSGKKNLGFGKDLGYTSIVFLGGGALLIGIETHIGRWWDGYGYVVIGALSTIVGSAIGTIGTIVHVNGKSKIRDVMDYAENEIGGSYGGGLNLQITSNGVGLVYSF